MSLVNRQCLTFAAVRQSQYVLKFLTFIETNVQLLRSWHSYIVNHRFHRWLFKLKPFGLLKNRQCLTFAAVRLSQYVLKFLIFIQTNVQLLRSWHSYIVNHRFHRWLFKLKPFGLLKNRQCLTFAAVRLSQYVLKFLIFIETNVQLLRSWHSYIVNRRFHRRLFKLKPFGLLMKIIRRFGMHPSLLAFYFTSTSNTFLPSRKPSSLSSIFTGPTPAGVPVKRRSPTLKVK